MKTVREEDREGGIRWLVLDRPPANAIDESLLADLFAAVERARVDDAVRAVVLTGAGAFFSGGFDLSAPRREAEVVAVMNDMYRGAHRALLALPKPTIARVAGHAIAGGLVLALACDYRLGRESDWKLGLNEVAIGASYPKAAIEIVKLRLTHAQAAELTLGAGLYPVSHAVRLGAVHELLPAADFDAAVLRRAERLAAFPREAYAHTKAALVAEALARIDAHTRDQGLADAAVWMTEESRAARRAQRTRLGKSE
ncbi:MAG TPA: enoyl-CoA hydratase/isomerase family protein [Myxococcota bacterium]|nr:enoyl-CoA hydratase/isomerase family protein [Myxococcota bacterium]